MNVEIEKKIRGITEQFFESWSSRDFEDSPAFCHKDALFFVKTSQVPPRSLSFIKQLPGFVGIKLKEIKQINTHLEHLASVLIEYEMFETHEGTPKIVGNHMSYLSMMKIDGDWTITGITDYGVEV